MVETLLSETFVRHLLLWIKTDISVVKRLLLLLLLLLLLHVHKQELNLIELNYYYYYYYYYYSYIIIRYISQFSITT
jgi:hypothetical protein